MRSISKKTGFLALTLVAITSVTGSLLTACSNADQNQAQAGKTTAEAANKQHTTQGSGMNHGSAMVHATAMNHNMSMDLGPADADYDLRFIDAMIPHHQGAVIMAKDAQQNSQRPELKKLADDIIKAQDKEIKQLQQWRKAWYPKASDKPMAYHAQMGHMMEMSPEQMQSMMMTTNLGAADAEFDLRFIDAMIPHHEGALVMAKDVLAKSKRPELKQLAQDILSSQQKEIDQMKQWRQAWYKK
jgi:uncharacterized protein (DUF305 family)